LLEKLRKKLASENLGVEFVAVNQDAPKDRVFLGTFKGKAGDLHVIQDDNDNDKMGIWIKYAANKDDIYVVDRQGKITNFFELHHPVPNSDLREGGSFRVEQDIRRTVSKNPRNCTTY